MYVLAVVSEKVLCHFHIRVWILLRRCKIINHVVPFVLHCTSWSENLPVVPKAAAILLLLFFQNPFRSNRRSDRLQDTRCMSTRQSPLSLWYPRSLPSHFDSALSDIPSYKRDDNGLGSKCWARSLSHSYRGKTTLSFGPFFLSIQALQRGENGKGVRKGRPKALQRYQKASAFFLGLLEVFEMSCCYTGAGCTISRYVSYSKRRTRDSEDAERLNKLG